jgi:negative regulator of flagellin synthesis FlgM
LTIYKAGDKKLNVSGINISKVFDVSGGAKAAPRISRAEERRDVVALSARAKDFSVARKALDAASDMRLDNVNAIKGRIESGTYNISAEMVANKILSGARGGY